MRRKLALFLIVCYAAGLAGCGGFFGSKSGKSRGGGFYQDDGPGANPPADIAAIPEPEPRVEPLNRAANNRYTVFGKEYVPAKELRAYKQRGIGSWYGRKFHGQRTSSGETYNMYAMTAAHTTLPIPSYALVTNLANRRTVIVRINDRGPFHSGRIIDLSYTAAYKLGYVGAGSAQVEVEQILPQDMPAIIKQMRSRNSAAAPQTEQPAAPVAELQIAPSLPLPAPPVPVAASIASLPEIKPDGNSSPDARAAEPAAPTTPEAAPIPIAAEAAGIYLQLGAFSARDSAENFRVRAYQQLGWLNQAIEIVPRDGLFRLHLGPYRDRAEAEEIAGKIREAMELKPVVVVR